MLIVKFDNGEIVQNTSWLSLPNNPIKRLKYLFNGKIILMENYESYNHLVEKVYNLLGGGTTIRAVYLMGMKNNKVKVIRLNLLDRTIKEEETVFNKEYNGRPSTGWKAGILASTPQYQII